MPTQQELENLIRLFQGAREQLLDTIVNYQGVGTKVYANTILQQVELQLKRMEKKSAFYTKSVIPAEYQKALDSLYAYFSKNHLLMAPPAAFAQLHNDAIYTIAREMQYQIGQGLEQAGRQIIRYVNDARDDVLRMAGLEAAGEKLASGSTVQQMQRRLIDRLQAEGFMTVRYGEGPRAYQVGIDSYAAMVARSTTREAGNIARENQLTANGYDLVKMSEHYPTCEVCAKLQGRVYSISGKDPRFPPLSRAFASGYHNVHPQCRHSVSAWIESLQTPEEVEAAIQKSNQPFEDSRSQQEIDLYNSQQGENRRVRQDLYRYERYKARLGEDAPKSFHRFRQEKKRGGNSWGKVQLDYRRRCRLQNAPSLALPDYEKA
ncbi:MAG: phage minor capsid protein, partial [Bacillota bacterium]